MSIPNVSLPQRLTVLTLGVLVSLLTLATFVAVLLLLIEAAPNIIATEGQRALIHVALYLACPIVVAWVISFLFVAWGWGLGGPFYRIRPFAFVIALILVLIGVLGAAYVLWIYFELVSAPQLPPGGHPALILGFLMPFFTCLLFGFLIIALSRRVQRKRAARLGMTN